MFAPTTKNERISGAFALDKSNFLSCSSPCCVRWFGHAVLSQKNVGKQTKAAVNVLPKEYCLAKDVARAAELQVGSAVCRIHWDEIRRSNNRCLVRFLEKTIHEVSGNSEFLPDFLLSWTL